jgi:7tm Chemosensory receptor
MDFKNSLYIISFQLTGLCTAQLPNRRSLRGFWLCCIALLYLALIGVVLAAAWQNINIWFDHRDAVSQLTDVMQLMCPVLAQLVCTVESLTRRNKQKKIFHLALNIDTYLAEIGVDISDENGQLFRHFGTKFLISVVLCTATELTIIYRICCGVWFQHWCGKFGSFFVDRISDLQFLFHLDYLTSRGKCLNDELLKLLKPVGSSSTNKLLSYERQSCDMHQRLRQLKYLHNQYFHLMLKVQKRFAWSILATVMSNFLCLTVGMYWIYANFFYKTEKSYLCKEIGNRTAVFLGNFL